MTPKSYVADTVALARYFEDSLPPKAGGAFREAEEGRAMVLVPEIVLGEFAYIAKGRLRTSDPRATIREVLSETYTSSHLRPVSMSEDAWERFFRE